MSVSGGGGAKICRRCLLNELNEDEYFRSLKEYIAAYPEDKRCSGEEYERRLKVCQSCDRLTNGMCAVCGCYVELRALKIKADCPEGNKWAK